MTKYTTYGNVRGQGPVRETREQAEKDARQDSIVCERQHGYSDRNVVVVGEDGYLYHDEECESPVWPSHGRSTGAVRVE